MTIVRSSSAVALLWLLVGCGGTETPPVATPQSLPPAEPPADLTRAPVKAADAGKPDGTKEQGANGDSR